MGGFEGGDEGGYWDIDTLPNSMYKQNSSRSQQTNTTKSNIEINDSIYSIKAHARVSIFLKITGYQDGHPDLLARYVRLEDLYDTISFVPSACKTFTLEGCEDIPLESNSIYKAYKALDDSTADTDIEEFFSAHKVVVTKGIASNASLSKAASNAAAFMRMAKEVCNLILSTDELAKIGKSINPDIPFFIYDYPSANVSGLGEVVELFEEEPLDFELYTPEIACDETLVYKTFTQHLSANISLPSSLGWNKLDSKNIIERVADPLVLNDLYPAALLAYPEYKQNVKEGWFFSGCGPTLFRLR